MADSSIEWTDKVWNPVTGCTPVSAGCKNCYAKRMAKRLKGMGVKKYRNNFEVTCHPDALNEPLGWRKPRRIFVCSMGDLFHEDVPSEVIATVFNIAFRGYTINGHKFLFLTKRPQKMRYELSSWGHFQGYDTTAIHGFYFGVSVEDQATADERIPLLLQTPAAKRFVSYEPALGPVDFTRIQIKEFICPKVYINALDPGNSIESNLDQIIMGGETGPGASPLHPDWARSARDQCAEAGVPFFFKQWAKVKCKCYLNAKVASRASKGLHGGYVCPIHDWGVPEKGHLLDGKEHRELI